MRKIIIFAILFLGLQIHYHKNQLSLSVSQSVYADDWGVEYHDYSDDLDDYFDDYDGYTYETLSPDDLTLTSPTTMTINVSDNNEMLNNIISQLPTVTDLHEVTITSSRTDDGYQYTLDFSDLYDVPGLVDYFNQYNTTAYNMGTGTGGSSGGGGSNPTPEPPPKINKPNDPCSDAAKAAGANAKTIASNSSTSVGSAETSLHGYAGNSANPEYGTAIYQNTTTGAYTADVPYTTATSNATTTTITISPPTGTVPAAIDHDHSSGNGQSPVDLYILGDGNATYSSLKTSFVEGPGGVQYALVITDQQAFDKFRNDYPEATNADMSSGYFAAGTKFATAYNTVYNGISGGGPDARNAALAYVLEHYYIGATLYERSSNTSDFRAIRGTATVDPNNPTGPPVYSKSNCPN